MLNAEHVAILEQDFQAWNAWRGEDASILPDLSRANVCDAQR